MAIDYWNKSGSFFSMIELAKYYEHKEKKYIQALNVSIKANEILSKIEAEKDQNPKKFKKEKIF